MGRGIWTYNHMGGYHHNHDADDDDDDNNYIQGVFLTGTPPKNSKYKKVNLG